MTPTSDRAVVLGAGIAGLVTATVLRRRFREVVVLEADALPLDARHRKGVPQGNHVHVLLLRGLQELSGLFPDLGETLRARGVPAINLTRDLRYYAPTGLCPSFEGDIDILLPSRILLEAVIRERVKALDGVRFIEEGRARGLRFDGAAVRGVIAQRGEEQLELEAGLTVDCTGRASKTPEWLVESGLDAPPEVQIRSAACYATRWYRAPRGWDPGWRAVAVLPRPPDDIRVALINPVEGDGYTVTFCGAPPNEPPTDPQGFRAWVNDLRAPEVAAFLDAAEPTSPVHSFRQMGNRLRRYDQLRAPLEGMVALGDAFCALNPVYGQGMTVATLSALALGRSLDERGGRPDPSCVRRFHRRVAAIAQGPWMAATSQDYQIPGTVGPPPPFALRLANPYMEGFLNLMTSRRDAFRDFLRVAHMVASPAAMFKPAYLARILWGLVRGARP